MYCVEDWQVASTLLWHNTNITTWYEDWLNWLGESVEVYHAMLFLPTNCSVFWKRQPWVSLADVTLLRVFWKKQYTSTDSPSQFNQIYICTVTKMLPYLFICTIPHLLPYLFICTIPHLLLYQFIGTPSTCYRTYLLALPQLVNILSYWHCPWPV